MPERLMSSTMVLRCSLSGGRLARSPCALALDLLRIVDQIGKEGAGFKSLGEPWAREALKRVAAGETLREIALSYNVDHSTICRLKARYVAEV
jgi:hypothetical protein